MDSQNTDNGLELKGLSLLVAATALGTGYLQVTKAHIASLTLVGLGITTLALQTGGDRFTRKASVYTSAMLGAAMLGSAASVGFLSLKEAFGAFKIKNFLGIEAALLKCAWAGAVQGMIGVSLVGSISRRLDASNCEESSPRRWGTDEVAQVFNPDVREYRIETGDYLISAIDTRTSGWLNETLHSAMDSTAERYEPWALGVLSRRWGDLTDKQKAEAIEGIWDGSWQISFSNFIEAMDGHRDDLKVYFMGRDRVEDTWVTNTLQEVYKKLPFDKFATVINNVDRERSTSQYPNKNDDRGWASSLRPISVFNQVMVSTKMGDLKRQAEVDKLCGKKPFAWLDQYEQWNKVPTEGKKTSLASRFAILIDGVLAGGKGRDPQFIANYWDTLKPALPGTDKPKIEINEEDERVQEALMRLYQEIAPKDKAEWSRLLGVLEATENEQVEARFKAMGLISEEAFKEKALSGLPQYDPKDPSKRKKELVDKLKGLWESRSEQKAVEGEASDIQPESTSFQLPEVFSLSRMAKMASRLGDIGLAALMTGLYVTYYAERAFAYPQAFVIGAVVGGVGGCWLWSDRREGEWNLTPDDFSTFKRDWLWNAITLYSWASLARIQRACGSGGVVLGSAIIAWTTSYKLLKWGSSLRQEASAVQS